MHQQLPSELDAKSREEYIAQLEAQVGEMRRMESALQQREQRIQTLVENTPAPVAMLDRNMRYIFASRRWMVAYGVLKQDIIGKSHYEIFPDLPEHWREIHRRCLAGAVEGNPADRWEREDGTVTWINWEIFPWYETPDQIGGIIIFSENITERKEMEEALRKSEARLREINQQQERLLSTLNALSCPIVPVHDGILIMPLIGVIDSMRSTRIMDSLLAGIQSHRAEYVILDITGVPVVDTQVANHLLQATRAARLLGAQCLLVGITAEVAQTIVRLGVDLAAITSRSNLQDGINFALASQGRSFVNKPGSS